MLQVVYGSLAAEKSRTALVDGKWKKATGEGLAREHITCGLLYQPLNHLWFTVTESKSLVLY